jgi:hypothetical protein
VVSTGAAAAFSTGASAASATVSTSTCTDATIVTGAPAAAAIATGAGATITTFTGATIATGAIANSTPAVSTGAFTASAAAAVFMGAPAVLPPPQGRQTYHPLDTEQDISTAASAVTCAAGATSTGTASAAVEYDSLSRRAQMIILMDRNASNASNESLSASYVKSMYDSIMRQRNAIIAEVVKEKPELEILITDALDAPFLVENRQRPGKMHRVEKLVDIWEYYEQVPTLRAGFIGRSRATSLRSYTDTMCRYHSLAETAVTENRSRLRGWKSEPMSDVERARLFLMDGGDELGLQYPSCPRCQHNFFDGPPDNGTADELNSENVRAYMQVCQQVRAWKKDKENHEQPRCPTTLELIDKMPSAPKPRKKHGHCHCHQLKASRKGTCPLACFFQGVQYAYSQCPICLCTCDAFVDLAQYHAIVTVTTLPATQIRNQDSRHLQGPGLRVQ